MSYVFNRRDKGDGFVVIHRLGSVDSDARAACSDHLLWIRFKGYLNQYSIRTRKALQEQINCISKLQSWMKRMFTAGAAYSDIRFLLSIVAPSINSKEWIAL